MFLALHKSMAKLYHSIYLLLFFSIITGVYSSGYCAVEAVDPNSYEDAPLLDSVDDPSNTLRDSDAGHNSNTYKDGSFLSFVHKTDDCALLGAMECLLGIAIKNNDDHLINILKLSKAPYHLSTGNDATALQCADLNHEHVIKFLRDNIVSHTGTYESGEGLLSAAIPSGNNKLIELLIGAGVNVNSYDNNNNTPLHQAVRCSHLNIVKTLLMAGAEVDCIGSHIIPDQGYDWIQEKAYDSGDHISPLQTAILNKNIKIVNVLLDSKANPNYYNNGTSTPLLLAIHIKSDPIVKALLTAGSAVDEILDSGKYAAYVKARKYTLLRLAVSMGSNELLQFLIQKGANPDEIYEDGDRPLHIAASRISSTVINIQLIASIYESLITAGADVNCKNEKGLTPLLTIASNDYFHSKETSSAIERICSMLFSNGADVDIIDEKGNTALHYAAEISKDYLALLLLENGAKRNIGNLSGLTAEECAAPKISKIISNASLATRKPTRLQIIVRSSIRNNFINKCQNDWHKPLSHRIRQLPLPQATKDFLANPT
ncbi:MAG: ankyrin repeat domain-containing protein [Candidatus Endonucleobacter bathymodioli]|uniref:Ankyrin repeat domain-containing protein n=1 Tax=Candidatus Endonucleibacter bathymodioli TaxID=539814 RepID=A0AA90SWY5_9GAMM|nr:ankyrin repeat domain-containing protein [Candidatus Endonucleobacter bathymodioli]